VSALCICLCSCEQTGFWVVRANLFLGFLVHTQQLEKLGFNGNGQSYGQDKDIAIPLEAGYIIIISLHAPAAYFLEVIIKLCLFFHAQILQPVTRWTIDEKIIIMVLALRALIASVGCIDCTCLLCTVSVLVSWLFSAAMFDVMFCDFVVCIVSSIYSLLWPWRLYAARRLYTVSQKNVPLCDCPYLRQILTDFQNFFTGTFCGQVAVVLLLNIPPNLNCVSTLPCETLIVKNV